MKKVRIYIEKDKKGFALYVGLTCVRVYSRRGEGKAADDARMIVYALNELGIKWETDIELGPL